MTIKEVSKQYSDQIIELLNRKVSYEVLYESINEIYTKVENIEYENGGKISEETQDKIWNEIIANINEYEIKKGLYEQENKATTSIINTIRKSKRGKKK